MPRLSRDYVCCAIPLSNVGIFAVLGQFFVVSFTTGILCFTAPSIVAVSIPKFGATILGVLCVIIALLQIWGVASVLRCSTKQYQLYTRISIPLIGVTMLLALVWIVISGVNHNAAVTACLAQFLGGGNNSASGTSTINGVAIGTQIGTSGRDICNIFTYVQLGIMIFLFIFVLLAELYFCQVARIYGGEQRMDKSKYASVLSADAMGAPYTKPADDLRPLHKHSDSALSKSSIDYGSAQAYKPSGLRYEQAPPSSYDDPYGVPRSRPTHKLALPYNHGAPSYPPSRTPSPYYN